MKDPLDNIFKIKAFVNFKTASYRLQHGSAYNKSQKLLLKEELRNKFKDRQTASNHLERLKSDLHSKLRFIDVCSFRLWLSVSARKFDASVKVKHLKKLTKLSPNFRIETIKPEDVIFNLSSHQLSRA